MERDVNSWDDFKEIIKEIPEGAIPYNELSHEDKVIFVESYDDLIKAAEKRGREVYCLIKD